MHDKHIHSVLLIGHVLTDWFIVCIDCMAGLRMYLLSVLYTDTNVVLNGLISLCSLDY